MLSQSLRIIAFIGLSLCPLAADSTFEPRPVHPLAINSNGSRLFAVNPAEGRLSVFAVGPIEHTQPILIAEIPVGLVPVTVRMRNDDEAWVVNELSDTISVVSISSRSTIATIHTGDEPADLVFHQGKAYLTCSRDNSVEVYDEVTHDQLSTIPLQGLLPRALATSSDGSVLHVAFQHTSNGTTILPRQISPAQTVPAYTNPDLPSPPLTAKIVSVDHADIGYNVLDHDIANIDVATESVTYQGAVGTNILALERLGNGSLAAANSEARNLISFETELKSRFAYSRVATVTGSTVSQIDLNDDPDPSFPTVNTASAATALAQPMALLAKDNDQIWVAAYGSDRIALVDTTNSAILQRVDLRGLDAPAAERSAWTVRGPRGLAKHPSLPWLYSYNKLSHTLSVIDTRSYLPVAEVSLASFEDLDSDLKMGRAFLQDARLSGNGSVSCATCHIDLERDGMAWDLGDPTGSMLSIVGYLRSIHAYTTPITHDIHPMKGPLTTQTLIGLKDQTKLHWRGDKPSIQSFNSTFPNLMGGTLLPDEEMDKIANYLNSLNHHPNPYQELDRNPPATLNGGDPIAGVGVFALFDNHCIECHSLPSGTSNNIDLPSNVASTQPLKDPPLRTLYQRQYFNPTSGGDSITGFGLLHNGTGSEFPIVHPYTLHILDNPNRDQAVRDQEKLDLTAFLLSFDTGTAPSVGAQVTLNTITKTQTATLQRLEILENQTAGEFPNSDLVLRGIYQGNRHSFVYLPDSESYQANSPSIPNQSRADLIASMESTDVLIATGVPLGSAQRYAIDRNSNGMVDGEEQPPQLTVDTARQIRWPNTQSGWHLLKSGDLSQWSPFTAPVEDTSTEFSTQDNSSDGSAFFRLLRNW
ncbi:beta-propeller fold lactonase family protein [Verrucomicrobiaceae bacterium R5-34]|nr:beta-propeller fold lactonase family protein [Verrucomicrobiaceae bacterium R5-34]